LWRYIRGALGLNEEVAGAQLTEERTFIDLANQSFARIEMRTTTYFVCLEYYRDSQILRKSSGQCPHERERYCKRPKVRSIATNDISEWHATCDGFTLLNASLENS
jgi:hypothetical protein